MQEGAFVKSATRALKPANPWGSVWGRLSCSVVREAFVFCFEGGFHVLLRVETSMFCHDGRLAGPGLMVRKAL
eukprot:1159659-Pelagomonas_calceolata.AAC.6